MGSEGTMGDQQRPAHRTGKRKFYVEEISHQQFQRAPTPINHIADELCVVEILQAVEQHSEFLPINSLLVSLHANSSDKDKATVLLFTRPDHSVCLLFT